MTVTAERVARLRSSLDEDRALALLKRAIRAPSVTGSEKAFAQMLAGELQALGAERVAMTDFAPGRPNVTGVLNAACGGGQRRGVTPTLVSLAVFPCPLKLGATPRPVPPP